MSFLIWWFALYVDARAPLAGNCEIHDFVSKFADRVSLRAGSQRNRRAKRAEKGLKEN